MSFTAEQAHAVLEEAECLYSADEVHEAFDRLAAQINAKLEGTNPLVLCVMNGGLVPAGHLLTRLSFPLQFEYIHATRYRGDLQGGELHLRAKPVTQLAGRVVLVIDDILDEGVTLARILEYCREQGADEVASCVLVEKRHDRKVDVAVDFVGLEVEDRYVFGYGMDYKGYLRNAPGIFAVKGT